MYKPSFQKREVLVFRQFQRKGYSLFACLGREVVISVLSVATLSSTKAAGISDETWRVDSTGFAHEVRLADVGITGSRAPLTKGRAARMVTVLSREDIAQAPVQSVNDLLKYAVGVDVRQRGALGSQTDISIRGGTQEQITILLNGINICDPQTGHNVLDLPIQLDEIVRIEVLEGPAGRVYGTSSLVGAVNIVTHPEAETSADVTLEGGSFGYAAVGGRANAKSGQWNNQLSAGYRRSDGYSRSRAGSLNTDYEGGKAFYQGAYDDEQVHVAWHAGIAAKGWGSSTFYATPRWQADDQYEHTTKLFTAVQASTKQGVVHLQPSLYWNQHRDRYEGYRGQPDVMKYNYNRCNVYGLSLNSYFDSPIGRTAFGAELRNEDLVSGNLGEPLSRQQHIGGTDRYYTLGVNRTNISAHLEHNVLLDRLTLSAGFVAAKSSWSCQDMKVYPGVDVSYTVLQRREASATAGQSLEALPTTISQSLEASPTTISQSLEASPTTGQSLEALPTTISQSLEASPTTGQNLEALPTAASQSLEASSTTVQSLEASPTTVQSLEASPTTYTLKVFAGWNTSLRLPSFTEMYYKLQGYAADPHLKPEEMQALEAGVMFNVQGTTFTAPLMQAKATLFHHHGRNMIDWIMDTRDGDAAVWQSVNHTRLNTNGLEVSTLFNIPLRHAGGPSSAARPLSLALSYNYMHQDKVADEGIVSQYALEYLRHKFVATLQVPVWRQLDARLGFRWQDREGSYTTFDGQVRPYRPFALADARLQWAVRRCTVYAEVNNLLNNRRYVDYGNVPQPGTWVVVGTKLHLLY